MAESADEKHINNHNLAMLQYKGNIIAQYEIMCNYHLGNVIRKNQQ